MNKPVAWMDEINTFVLDKDYQQFPKSLQHGMIPLYTHPAEHDLGIAEAIGFDKGYKANKKELTDEEIDNLIMEVAEKPTNEDLYDFARAILRKAQEK